MDRVKYLPLDMVRAKTVSKRKRALWVLFSFLSSNYGNIAVAKVSQLSTRMQSTVSFHCLGVDIRL